MPAINIIDLNNAKADVDHIAAVATSTAATATDRKGNTKKTLAGVIADAEERADDAMVEIVDNIGNHYADTYDDLTAIVSPAAGAGGIVTNDPDPAVNGWYRKTGAAGAPGWERIESQPASERELSALDSSVQAIDSRTEGVDSGSEIEQEDGDYYGMPVAGMIDETGNAPLIVNEDGEVGVPRLLPGEVIAAKDRGIQANYDLSIVDDSGNVVFGVDEKGKFVQAPDEIVATEGSHNYVLAFADETGNVVAGLLDGEWVVDGGGSPSDPGIVQEMEIYAQSLRVTTPTNLNCATMAWDYNQVIGNGQSNVAGNETWPALSAPTQPGLWMIGDSVRPFGAATTDYVPVGSAVLNQLAASVQAAGNSGILTPEQVEALTPGDQARGETPVESMSAGLLRAVNDHFQTGDAGRHIIASNVSVGGRTIEALSKGATPELYLRYTEAISLAKGLADGESKSFGVAAVALAQGEYNYVTTHGGDNTEAGYRALFLQWIDDMVVDALGITGQSRPPAFITYQTGASYTVDSTNLSIGMAQWNATRERRNLFMAAPMYPVTDKGAHLDANGARWLGWQFAKVARHVIVERLPWRPLEPVRIEQDGRSVYVAYRVPRPPLQFRLPYVINEATDYPAKGFRIVDDIGDVSVEAVSIVSPCVIRIDLSRDTTGTAFVWYGSKSVTNGNGCVCDSDDSLADDLYEYLPGTGMYPSADIPELNDKPYPLNNWSIAFRLPVGYQEQI